MVMGIGTGILMAFGNPWQAEEIAVPSVKGKQLALARQILEDDRLRVNVAEIYDSKVPAGEVVKQEPDAGKNVKLERLVTIYVSKGGETIDMPDLVGLSKSAATERIQKMGLQLGSIYEKDSDYEPGIIVSQDPAFKTKINRGQVVDLVISRGQKRITAVAAAPVKTLPQPVKTVEKIYVPNVQSASLEMAKFSVENSGLKVGNISYQESLQAANTIISQNPAAASYV